MDSESTRRGPENDPLYEQIKNLPEKSQTTIRFFDRDNTITVYNEDAELLAKKFFRSDGVLKKWGASVIYINLSVINFENVLREALLSWRYRAELYVKESGCWILSKKASPGNLAHFEDDVFAADSDNSTSRSDEFSTCFVSIRLSGTDSSNVTVGLAFVDVLLREISVIEFQDTPNLYNMETILFQKGPTEAIIKKGTNDKPLSAILERAMILVSEVLEKIFDSSNLVQDLNSILLCKKNQTLNVAVLPELTLRHASKALAAAIKYLDLVSQYHQGQFTLKILQDVNYVRLDPSAIKALHLLPDPMEGVTKEKCLSGILNKCRTAPGQRLLGQYLRQPLTDVQLIEERLDCVTLLVNNPDIRGHLHDNILRRVPDIQRLTTRFQKQKATLKDVHKVFCGVELLPSLLKVIEANEDAKNNSAFMQKFIQPINELSGDLNKFVAMVRTVLDFSKIDSGQFLINPKFSPNLREANEEIESIKSRIDSALNSVARKIGREAEKGVKLEIHALHGHCFRVPVKDDKLVRESKEFTWLDNKKDGIRFTNSKMQELSEEYSVKMQEYNEQQKEIVAKVLDITLGYLDPFYRFNNVIAELDVMNSFAVFVATSKDAFVRPEILPAGRDIKLTGVRHPCVEKEEKVYYIPNDINLVRNKQQLLIITGPNMGGKSTFIRSVGVVCLLAQVGCYVPCSTAQISVVDAIMARIGANDAIEKGVSSFMAEMLETNVILNTATENSLVIIDELGRGTSTFDGFGLAWAISEHLVNESKCFCLFATHFHELTELEQKFEKVRNYHFTAKVDQDQLVMMYKMQPGACDQSFGLQVAKMVGFPDEVMRDAEEKLESMGSSLFTWEDDKIIRKLLREIDGLPSSMCESERLQAIRGLMNSVKNENEKSNVAMCIKSIID